MDDLRGEGGLLTTLVLYKAQFANLAGVLEGGRARL